MRRYPSFVLIGLLTLIGCKRSAEQKVPRDQPGGSSGIPSQSISGTAFGDFVIGDPVTYKNLSIFPVSSRELKNADRFITLDEGLKAGTVKIVEIGSPPGAINEPIVDQLEEQNAIEPQETNPSDDEPVVDETVSESPTTEQPTINDPDDDALFGEDTAGNDIEVPEDQQIQVDGLVPQLDEDVPQVVQQVQQVASAGDSAEVNRLLVHNTSDRPLYLMPGEVISGGYQDRTIGQEVVIQPSDQPIPLDAFCVEHGRWSTRSVEDAAELLETAATAYGGIALTDANEDGQVDQEALQKLADKANAGEFVASVGQLNKAARFSLQTTKDQSVVWEEVAKVNAKTGADLPSGNFTANYASESVVDQLEPYLEACHEQVLSRPQIVGVVVAINGKVTSADVFESTPLFKKFWPKLLKSFAVDAVAAADQADDKQSCDVAACIDFLKQLEAAQVAKVEVDGDLKLTQRKSESLTSFSALDAAASEDSEGAAGGFGGGVHTSAFAH